jgi:hypothetical protein
VVSIAAVEGFVVVLLTGTMLLVFKRLNWL